MIKKVAFKDLNLGVGAQQTKGVLQKKRKDMSAVDDREKTAGRPKKLAPSKTACSCRRWWNFPRSEGLGKRRAEHNCVQH